MPKRSDREVYAKYFGKNPFNGISPEKIYKELKWGNQPKEVISIFAAEPLVSLGYVAKIFMTNGYTINCSKNKVHLAVGANTNYIYMFPRGTTKIPYHNEQWKSLSLVQQTDYYSDKGNEECYYYHEHEPPYPILSRFPNKNIFMLLPQDFNGQRSYAVIKEGIVG